MKKYGESREEKETVAECIAKKLQQPLSSEEIEDLRELFGINSKEPSFYDALAIHADE